MNGYQKSINLKPARGVKDTIGEKMESSFNSLATKSRQKARAIMKIRYPLLLSSRRNVVHHKNHDPLDNRLSNLQIMSNSDHISYHVNQYWNSQNAHFINKYLKELDSLLYLYNHAIWIKTF